MRRIAFLLMPAIAIMAASCNGGNVKGPQTITVSTQKVSCTEAPDVMEFPFISKPYRTSELSFRVGGPIMDFDVFPGNFYPEGSVIAEIDPRDFIIRKERAEASYRQMEAEFQRIDRLYGSNSISASQYERTRAEWISARTAYETASNDMEDTRMSAPFNGYVGEVHIERFQEVAPSQPVISLIDIDILRIEIYVTQDVAFRAQDMEEIEVRFDAAPEKVYTARIADVSKGTTSNNISYLMTALLPNPDRKLLSGMSGKASIRGLGNSRVSGVSVPQAALCHSRSEGDFVWVLDTGTSTVSRREVSGSSLLPDGRALIAGGLETGETVVTSGMRFLAEGMEVNVLPDMI